MLTKLLTIFVKGLRTNIVAYPIFRKVIIAETDCLSVKKAFGEGVSYLVLVFNRLFSELWVRLSSRATDL